MRKPASLSSPRLALLSKQNDARLRIRLTHPRLSLSFRRVLAGAQLLFCTLQPFLALAGRPLPRLRYPLTQFLTLNAVCLRRQMRPESPPGGSAASP